MTKPKSQEKRRKILDRSCLSKVRHETREAAYSKISNVFVNTGEQLKPYRCKFCGGWHIGH